MHMSVCVCTPAVEETPDAIMIDPEAPDAVVPEFTDVTPVLPLAALLPDVTNTAPVDAAATNPLLNTIEPLLPEHTNRSEVV